mgnify:CR=1 FL=1
MKSKFFQRYLSSKVLPIWTILLIDVFIIVVSCMLSYALRYDFRSIFLDSSTIDRTILWTVIINLVFFRVFRTYSNVLRFSSFVDIMRIFVSLTVSYGLLTLVSVILEAFMDVRVAPVSVLFMAYIINFALMSCSRIVVKMLFEVLNFDGSKTTNVFIYGAKEAGVNIAKSLRVNLRNHYRLRGFIADEPELIDKIMMGVKVYPNDDTLIEKLDDRDVHTIIISPVKMDQLKKTDMADLLLAHNVKLLTAPPLSEWGGQPLNRTQLKEIQIEDLLQREPIEVDIHKIASHLEGKRVMITGAAGSIGSEIMRQVASFNPYKLILVDQAETPLHDIRLELQDRWRDIDAETIVADISNQTRIEAIFREFRPQYIFHAAAYKHVPMMEDNVSESIQVNVAGTRILADLAVKYGAEKFVMISTDKAVNPTNVMGCSKRICEIYVQSLAKKLQKKGIIVDVSHLSERGFYDVAEYSEKPFIATHSDCDIVDNPFAEKRNLTDAQIRIITEQKGIIGLNLYEKFLGVENGAGLCSVIRQIEHFCSLGAEHTICLGCDFDGCTVSDDLCGIDKLYKIANGLARENYSDELINGIFFDNANAFIVANM